MPRVSHLHEHAWAGAGVGHCGADSLVTRRQMQHRRAEPEWATLCGSLAEKVDGDGDTILFSPGSSIAGRSDYAP